MTNNSADSTDAPKALIIAPTMASFPFLEALCELLAENGWQVHWVSSSLRFQARNPQATTGLNFHEIDLPRGANLLKHLAAAKQLRRLVATLQPDVIDVHFSAAILTAAIAKTSTWPMTIGTAHGLRFPIQTGFRRLIEKAVEVWAARRMNHFWVLTNDDVAAIEPFLNIPVAKQPGYGMGCNLTKFDRDSFPASVVTALKKELEISEHDVVSLYIGRRVSFKGFDKTVRAFLAAQHNNSNLHLVICGNIDGFHPSGLTASEEDAVESNPKIHAVGWQDDVAPYLCIADFLIFPSQREGMPVNLMEATAMGVPIITIDSRGCRDVVRDGVNGVVLALDDPDILKDAILKLANSSSKRAELRANALKLRAEFDQRSFARQKLDEFERRRIQRRDSTKS